MKRYKWGPWLPIITVVGGMLVAVYIVWPQMTGRGDDDAYLLWILSWTTAIIWGMIAVLSGYQLLFQILATVSAAPLPFELRPTDSAANAADVRFLVLYLTCDDFVFECCLSCMDQEYPEQQVRIIICDDSREPESIAKVDEFKRDHPNVEVVRRENREHFKAGNLNFAFRHAGGDCQWVVVVDADQALPQDYLSRLAEILKQLPKDVAFLQGGRLPLDAEYGCPLSLEPTPFQTNMQPETVLFYERSLAWRTCLGFSPFLGHGGAIRATEWNLPHGFPNRVSEDVAWTLDALARGKHGVYVHSLRSWEAYPRDFSAFLTRVCKFAAGAAEIFVRDQWRLFWPSRIKATDRFDALLWFWGYALLPLGLLNLFCSAYVAYQIGETGAPLLAPILPYLFLGMWCVSLAASVSVISSFGEAIRYWFWSFAVYSAAWPAAAWSFAKALVKSPKFNRTPKVEEQIRVWNARTVCGFIVGGAGIATALIWRSPYSWVLSGFSSGMLLSPLFTKLHLPESAGARAVIYLPGALFITGLVLMWLET